MKTPLKAIEDLGIPTVGYITTIRSFIDSGRDFSKEEYETHVAEIIGIEPRPSFVDQKTARFYFMYTIQETVRAFTGVAPPDMELLWEDIKTRTEDFLENNPWVLIDYAEASRPLDDDGNPKAKKGDKKVRSQELYIENKDNGLSRKEWIALFVSEIDMSPAGASTYYANMKKKYASV